MYLIVNLFFLLILIRGVWDIGLDRTVLLINCSINEAQNSLSLKLKPDNFFFTTTSIVCQLSFCVLQGVRRTLFESIYYIRITCPCIE